MKESKGSDVAIGAILDGDGNKVGFAVGEGCFAMGPPRSEVFTIANGGIAMAVGRDGELVLIACESETDPKGRRVSLAFHGLDVLGALLAAVLRAGGQTAEQQKKQDATAPAGWESVDGGATLADEDRPKRWTN